MMSKPDAEMDGTICKECNRLISDHLPEELEECIRKQEDEDISLGLVGLHFRRTLSKLQQQEVHT